MDKDNKTDILSLDMEEMKEFMQSIDEPSYRAEQVFYWLHKGVAFENMSNLSKSLREKLAEKCSVNIPTAERKLVSKLDGTVKYLYSLADGNLIESVVMRYKHGISICISSQCGCRMGCRFCASAIGGKVRDLTASEMLGQIIACQRDIGERISNVVMMGIGEPLENYDNVVKFLKLVNNQKGLCIGYRHISLSTCGVVAGIDRLAEEGFPITLSVSLHASDDKTRSALMPINNKWNIEKLLLSCDNYYKKTGRRISFEYTLIKGENDSRENAIKLAQILKKYLKEGIHVNLIPLNSVSEKDYLASEKNSVMDFSKTLMSMGINATVRRTLGSDINASCGQLRRQSEGENSKVQSP